MLFQPNTAQPMQQPTQPVGMAPRPLSQPVPPFGGGQLFQQQSRFAQLGAPRLFNRGFGPTAGPTPQQPMPQQAPWLQQPMPQQPSGGLAVYQQMMGGQQMQPPGPSLAPPPQLLGGVDPSFAQNPNNPWSREKVQAYAANLTPDQQRMWGVMGDDFIPRGPPRPQIPFGQQMAALTGMSSMAAQPSANTYTGRGAYHSDPRTMANPATYARDVQNLMAGGMGEQQASDMARHQAVLASAARNRAMAQGGGGQQWNGDMNMRPIGATQQQSDMARHQAVLASAARNRAMAQGGSPMGAQPPPQMQAGGMPLAQRMLAASGR